jgi:ABC-2 type transport system permease protein
MIGALRRIINLAWKELLHFGRDRVLTPMILFGPVLELTLIGIATSSEIDQLPTVVLNQDTGSRSAALVSMIESDPTFDVRQEIARESEAHAMLAAGKITAAFVIPNGFSAELSGPNQADPADVTLLLDGADTSAAQAARYGAEGLMDRFATMISAQWLSQAGISATSFQEPTITVLYNKQLKKSFYELPAEMGIMLYFVAAGVASLGIARERERGTWEQLLVTPMRPLEIVIGKALPAIPIAFAVFLMMLGVSLIGFGIPLRGSWLLLLAVVLLYILVELGVGVLISALSKTQIQALLLVVVLMMIEFIFSGYIFAVDTMPIGVQVLANFVPMNHGLNMVRSILLRGVGFAGVWTDVLALVGLGAVILALATLVLRSKLE